MNGDLMYLTVPGGPCPRCRIDGAAILAALARIEHQLEEVMSEDAAVAAVVADENAQIANLTGALSSLQSVVQALQAEVASGTALQPATLASLQAAEAALDTVAQQAAADVAADQPAPAAPAADDSAPAS
jgi:chromosome segregation ATPase